MRHLLKLSMFAFVLSLTFTACKEDKEEVTPSNSFSYDGQTYDTPKGYIEDSGMNDDNQSADLDILLCSSSITYNATSEEYEGVGHVVYIDLNSTSASEIASGTYTYVPIYFDATLTRQPNTFVDASILFDYDLNNQTGTEYFIGGVSPEPITVKKSGDIYEISYSYILESGKEVKGYYKGALETIKLD